MQKSEYISIILLYRIILKQQSRPCSVFFPNVFWCAFTCMATYTVGKHPSCTRALSVCSVSGGNVRSVLVVPWRKPALGTELPRVPARYRTLNSKHLPSKI